MTRKAALNLLTEEIERGGAGAGVKPRPQDEASRKQLAGALRKLARAVYPEGSFDSSYPVRIANEIDPLESGG